MPIFPAIATSLDTFLGPFMLIFVGCAHKSEICEQVTPIFHRYDCKTTTIDAPPGPG